MSEHSRPEITPETDLERRIIADPAWQLGIAWGEPRPGHPEGSINNHVVDVLANIDAYAPAGDAEMRTRLRLVALLHDICKGEVGTDDPSEIGHALRARRFAERFTDDETALEVIELHDVAYALWRRFGGPRDAEARERAHHLVDRLGERIELYRIFYRCDTLTSGKDPAPLAWFESFRVAETTDAHAATTHGREFIEIAEDNRLELQVAGAVVGWIDHRPAGASVILAHTEVLDGHEGEGLGGELVAEFMQRAAASGHLVLPTCPFAIGYLRRHPDLQAGVDPSVRAQVQG